MARDLSRSEESRGERSIHYQAWESSGETCKWCSDNGKRVYLFACLDTLSVLMHAYSFQESIRYMSNDQVTSFLDGAIRNRISVRLIAEQHIALSRALKQQSEGREMTHVGIVDMTCSPSKMIRMCGSFVSDLCEATLGTSPSLIIDGHTDATFP